MLARNSFTVSLSVVEMKYARKQHAAMGKPSVEMIVANSVTFSPPFFYVSRETICYGVAGVPTPAAVNT